MIFSLGPFLLYLFLLFRLVIFSGLKRRLIKVLAGLILLPLALPWAINRFLLGSGAAPELPSLALKIQGWCFFALILLLILLLLYDLLRLGKKLSGLLRSARNSPGKAPLSPGRRKAMFAMLTILPTTYGLKQAVDVPEVHKTEITLHKLPKDLDGLNIVQVSDLHASALFLGDRISAVVERVNALNADLVLFTGDMVDGLPASRLKSLSSLPDIKSRYGVYACAGNHEYYSNYPAWMKAFPQLGLTMLLNSHAVLNINGHQLVLAGLTDVAAAGYNLESPDLGKALANAPENALRILLDHRPNKAPQNAEFALNLQRPLDLQLSGHTHGGQIVGMSRIVARLNQGFVYGWYNVNGMPLYVSSGAGLWSGFPIRLGVPSEIAQITLHSV
ncbi:MAG: metallophosphoesterase [Deltaproteobacteria bacterium]|jgi:predicted MPP superfamily phosphohydrolase|nr:metallophosphoesterase [Deltaproteobacteria bacterium]